MGLSKPGAAVPRMSDPRVTSPQFRGRGGDATECLAGEVLRMRHTASERRNHAPQRAPAGLRAPARHARTEGNERIAAGQSARRAGIRGRPAARDSGGDRGGGGTLWGKHAPAPADGRCVENPPRPGGRLARRELWRRRTSCRTLVSNLLACRRPQSVQESHPCLCRRPEAREAAAPQSTRPGRRRFPNAIASGRSRGGAPEVRPGRTRHRRTCRPSGSAGPGGQP